MGKNQNTGKLVSRASALVAIVAVGIALFHLAKSAPDSQTSKELEGSAAAAEAALQSRQIFAAASENSENDFATPSGWEKLASVDPDLDLAKEAKILARQAKDAAPAGWHRIMDATELALPALAPASTFELSFSPLEAEPASEQGPTTKKFPTNQRVWTNYRGQLMVASILECDFKTGKLLMESDKGILRSYQLTQLSEADRAYLWSLAEEEGDTPQP